MTGILISERFPPDALQRLRAAAQHELRLIHLPADPEARLTEEELAAIEVAFYSGDIYETHNRSFFSAVQKAPKLAWMHTFNAGVDHPVFARLLAKGMRLSTSAGIAAVPIAQSAITGLLMLARGFPAWLQAQREHRWTQIRGAGQPADLAGQTLCVVGLGSIGTEIARLAQALGLSVIGVRRSPRRSDDPVSEIHPPSALTQVLPRCQWLALACPLTAETRKLIDGAALARLPRGARLINVARGEVMEEAALIEALAGGQLAGAYLDVFEKEPLPAESPLWDLPNVIVTPHNSGASSGNDARVLELFVHNFGQWLKAQPLKNEVIRAGT